MSGHSKWSQIKRQKGANDVKKAKIFSKFARLIALESKKCGGDIRSAALRAVIERAKEINMPNDNIERAVKRGAGGDAGNMEEVLYEAYGPGGCAIIIEGLTDNKNRTSQEIKHIFTKHGSALAGQGAALWNFEKNTGVNGEGNWSAKTTVKLSPEDATLLEKILEELDENDDVQGVYTSGE
ncbi:YebC/PmpR family DNA-binding transcriptional regulator [bacterium]|nr:YebC/PmpR family DNA-binding transcriptional regulator [bacterium]